MSKTWLWVAIGAAAFVVVALAVLTPTVIVDDHDGHRHGVRVSGHWAPYPLPGPCPPGADRPRDCAPLPGR